MSFIDFLNEEKKITIDVDWSPDSRDDVGLRKNARDSVNVIIKPYSATAAKMTGTKKYLKMILKHKAYFGYTDNEIKDLYPEVM